MKFYAIVKSSEVFENGCIPMDWQTHAGETEDPLASGQYRIGHCGALVIQRLDLTF